MTRLSARAATTLLSAALLASCGGKVDWVAGTGSGTGGSTASASASSTSSGPAVPVEAAITVHREASVSWCVDWQKPLVGIEVFSSNADGSLLDQATTDADGKASLLTIDGGYVSATWPDSEFFPEVHTYAIVGAMDAFDFSFAENFICTTDPMHLHVEVTPTMTPNPVVVVCGAWIPLDPATWTAEVDVLPCGLEGVITIALTDEAGQALLGVSDKTPFVSGGTATVTIGPPPAPVTIEVRSANTLASALATEFHTIEIDGTTLPADPLITQIGADASVTWSVPPAPGVRLQAGHSNPANACNSAFWYTDLDVVAAAGQLVQLDPERLARGAVQADGTWKLDDGELGDAVVALRAWGPYPHTFWWIQWLPASSVVTLPNLVLPGSIAKFLPSEPAGRVELDNIDRRDIDTYAAFVDAGAAPAPPMLIVESNTGCIN